MRKFLLIVFMQLFFCNLFAQTDVSTALDLKSGVNSYELEEASGYVTVYFKYTAPAESGQLISVSSNGQASGLSFSMSEDGTYNTQIYGIVSSTGTVFPVKAGQTVYLAVGVYNTTTVEFTMSAENAVVEGGASCDDAIVVTEGKQIFIPSHYDMQTYKSESYLSYACAETGVLEMTFSGYVSQAAISEGCDGESTTISLSYGSAGAMSGKAQVEAGKTYIIKVVASSTPLMGTFVLTHPTLGSSCDMPFDGKESGNVLPAEVGKYWYAYVAENDGFVEMSSEAGLPGGNISVYSSCGQSNADASVDGCFLMRFKVTKGYTYFVCIEKTEKTATEELFNMTYRAASEGDSFENPKTIEFGEYTAPEYNGTYYYKVNIPEGGSKFLKVTSDASFYSASTTVGIYDVNNRYSAIVSGTNDIKAEVKGGSSYIIVWNLDEDINGFKFNVEVEDIAAGEVASNPIQAVVGVNELAGGNDKYYSYTATIDGWLKITPDDILTEVKFPIVSGSYVSYRTAVKDAFSTKTEIKAGETYLIQFSGMSSDCTFELAENNYGEGESMATAILVEGTSVAVPEKAQSIWFKYVAPQNGMLTVTSDILFEQDATYQSSMVSVQREGDQYPVNIIKTDSGGSEFRGQFSVAEGETLYVKVTTLSAQSGKTVSFEIRDFEPGESSMTSIELKNGENTLGEATSQNPIWYYADLNAGSIKISSKDYFMMSLYKADDLNTVLATSTYVAGTAPDYIGSYVLDYAVSEAGRYIVKVEQTNATGAIVTVEASINTGIAGVEGEGAEVVPGVSSVIVAPADGSAVVEIYDISGKLVKSADIAGRTQISLAEGLYLVKVNGRTVKVVVRD